MNIRYIKGDATNPVGDGKRLVLHISNSIGLWGSGFVVALSKVNGGPEGSYRRWYKDGYYLDGKEEIPFQLGQIQVCGFQKDIFVCNMIGQAGCGYFHDMPPIRYECLRECLIRVREKVLKAKSRGIDISLHGPRFGSDRAGGDWTKIESIIVEVFEKLDGDFTIYDL